LIRTGRPLFAAAWKSSISLPTGW